WYFWERASPPPERHRSLPSSASRAFGQTTLTCKARLTRKAMSGAVGSALSRRFGCHIQESGNRSRHSSPDAQSANFSLWPQLSPLLPAPLVSLRSRQDPAPARPFSPFPKRRTSKLSPGGRSLLKLSSKRVTCNPGVNRIEKKSGTHAPQETHASSTAGLLTPHLYYCINTMCCLCTSPRAPASPCICRSSSRSNRPSLLACFTPEMRCPPRGAPLPSCASIQILWPAPSPIWSAKGLSAPS